MTPNVSVLLPVYNAEPYLAKAVESILDQTYENFELLALDDGCLDNSLAVLRHYAKSDRRITVLSRENRGIVQTLNQLVGLARGQFLARMDADDLSFPRRFEKQIQFLDANPTCVLVGGCVELIDDQDRPIGILNFPLSHEEIDECHLRGHTSIWHPTVVYRKAAIDRIGGYKDSYSAAEDLDLWLRLAELGRIANIPEVILRYRLHENSVSEANGEQQRQAARRACESAWQRRGIHRKFDANVHWRPGTDRRSQHDFSLRYAWMAWSAGNNATWWAYARKALRLRPFAIASWKVIIFGFLRRAPRQK